MSRGIRNRPAQSRRYEAIWVTLKRDLVAEVQLSHSELFTPEQLAKTLRTIRKAVQKEKYYDLQYKTAYPFADLVSTMYVKEGKILFTLKPYDIQGLF